MKKRNKIIVLVIVLSVAVIAGVGYKIADKFYAPLVQTKAVSYLCHKYDAKPNEFEMVDYNQAHIELKEYEIFFQKPVWVDFSFEYKYNGRNFVVRKNDNGWYDDYQLEDLEKWSTEWLQANADSSIKGCYFDTKNLLNYYKINNIDYGNPIAQEDIKNFLLDYVKYDYIKTIYYYIPENSDNYINEDEMNKIISKSLGVNLDVHAQNEDITLQKEIYKLDEWTSHIGI